MQNYVHTYVYCVVFVCYFHIVYMYDHFNLQLLSNFSVLATAAKEVKMPSVLLRKGSMPELSPGHLDVCTNCEKGVCDSCPLHHRWKRIQNREYYFDPDGLSKVKVPSWAAVATSNIPGAGLGLFARQKVKYGVHLGHYRGVRRDPSTVSKNEDMSYAWEVSTSSCIRTHVYDVHVNITFALLSVLKCTNG